MQCKELIHPFQNDPGVSQRQRVMDDLLGGTAQIDARSLADLLDYFEKLSRHINYYDADLNVSDWQSFFQNSLPFTITSILKYDADTIREKLAFYNLLFEKSPSKSSLQMIVNYVFRSIIYKIYFWNSKLEGSDLPVMLSLDKIIKDKLADSLKVFIVQVNSAVKFFGTKPINLMCFLESDEWNLDLTDLYAVKTTQSIQDSGKSKRLRMIALKNEILAIGESFITVIDSLHASAETSLEPSFLSLNDEFKEKLSPHLALLFSFLRLFRYLQQDLNSFTKKHLDFFYKEVLLLRAKPAIPDQVHLVFEIQKHIQKYLLKEGIIVKDSKDANKVEIQFALDDQIVVNKAKVVEQRTLFLNNKVHASNSYLEGVYMSSNAKMADGVEKPFEDIQNSSWPTLGSALSKYVDPESKFLKPYPNARLGFVLASPVLFLSEGTRKIEITLACKLHQNVCENENDVSAFYERLRTVINDKFYPINRDLIAQAVKKGISKSLKEKLEAVLWKDSPIGKQISCYYPLEEALFEKTITDLEYRELISSAEEIAVLKDIFKPIKAFNIALTGKKGWLVPDQGVEIAMSNISGSSTFEINISLAMSPDQEGIVNYDEELFQEGFDTALPLMKINLDDRVKIEQDVKWTSRESCCERKAEDEIQLVSLYQFFRSVKVSNTKGTKIKVNVCGLKNFVVQNSESLQNINSPIYPFGTRPEIIDFDIKNPPNLNNPTNLNLLGPDFFIGSQEVFTKKWNEIHIKLDWKEKPTDFRDYYKGYLKEGGLFGLDENKFLINLAVLENGKWIKEKSHGSPTTKAVTIQGETYNDRKLFENNNSSTCSGSSEFDQTIFLRNTFFELNQKFSKNSSPIEQYEVGTSEGFLKINLQGQDFCHKVYSYVLARQMMALGKLPDSKLEDAIYYDGAGNLIVFSTNDILESIETAKTVSTRVEDDVNNPSDGIKSKMGDIGAGKINEAEADSIRRTVLPPMFGELSNKNLTGDVSFLKNQILQIRNIIDNNDLFQAVIPNEPWTPIIKKMEIDYSATASMEDIELIHLYPFPGTYKLEQLEHQPSLLPTFCDEGNLFLAFKDLVPGSNVNILFQMAEATADSESEREPVSWHYLDNNEWKPLRNGFEVLEDDTDGLTSSGIIKFSFPANISNENTVLPKGLHWIKAGIAKNSKSVSETIGLFTQAIKATFTNEALNDKLRLDKGLPAGSISKMKDADVAIKSVSQPYDSFAGRVPEAEGHFYIRVSELLKHKGRAIQKFDYERLVLEAFPQLYKVKCVNHSFALDAHHYVNDIPMAPGYIIMAVIPDMNKLKASQLFEPRVPVSLLESIQEYLQERSSPFVKVRIMNPRYEGVNFCLKVKLRKGMDESFYREKLKQDLREFLAPWAIGEFDKLTFGQCIYESDIVGFLESRDYLDYIVELWMKHADEAGSVLGSFNKVVCPISPRSILIAGNIDVKIEQADCERWASRKEAEPCRNPAIPIENYCNRNYA